jgi:hypothetical protein
MSSIKKIVRPATALTRRKELQVKMAVPLEIFEELMQPLSETDTVGLERDSSTGFLKPTKSTTALNYYEYKIRRGSVTDKLFNLSVLDLPPPASKRQKKSETPARLSIETSAIETTQIGEDDVYEVKRIVKKRTKGTRVQYLIEWEG